MGLIINLCLKIELGFVLLIAFQMRSIEATNYLIMNGYVTKTEIIICLNNIPADTLLIILIDLNPIDIDALTCSSDQIRKMVIQSNLWKHKVIKDYPKKQVPQKIHNYRQFYRQTLLSQAKSYQDEIKQTNEIIDMAEPIKNCLRLLATLDRQSKKVAINKRQEIYNLCSSALSTLQEHNTQLEVQPIL